MRVSLILSLMLPLMLSIKEIKFFNFYFPWTAQTPKTILHKVVSYTYISYHFHSSKSFSTYFRIPGAIQTPVTFLFVHNYQAVNPSQSLIANQHPSALLVTNCHTSGSPRNRSWDRDLYAESQVGRGGGNDTYERVKETGLGRERIWTGMKLQ